MCVVSFFNDVVIESFKLYRVIEFVFWFKLVGWVNGVNFIVIYGGIFVMVWKEIKLFKNYIWKLYLEFLFIILLSYIRECYLKKFKISIIYWIEKGGVLKVEIVEELKNLDI